MTMPKQATTDTDDNNQDRGLARDFATYAELEYERRRNSFDDFDAKLFREAVELVKNRLRVS